MDKYTNKKKKATECHFKTECWHIVFWVQIIFHVTRKFYSACQHSLPPFEQCFVTLFQIAYIRNAVDLNSKKMFDCFRRQSGKLSLNQGHHLWVSLNIKEALLLITVRKIFVCSRRSPGNFHSNSLQLWPLQRQLQPLTLQIEIFPISNFNKVYSNRYSVTEIWPHHDILSLSLSLSPS